MEFAKITALTSVAASPAPPHAWSIQTRLEPGADTILLAVTGRLGSEGAAQVRGALDAAISAGGLVHLDLSGVDYISSAGLAVLRRAATALRMRGGGLMVAAASEPVRLALRLGGEPLGLAPPQ